MSKSPLAGLNLLLLEDDVLLRRRLTAFFEREQAEVTAVTSLASARQALGTLAFEAALIDVNLPDGRGIDLLREKAFPPTTSVIVMTAEGGVAGAVEALQAGAADYLVKPFDPAEVPLRFAAARRSRQSRRVEEFRRGQESELVFGASLSGLHEQLLRITAADRRLGEHLPPVLIEGETGTGKTAIARWIHRHGPRADEPLIELNCSALPEALAEAELFGHERGAFTDAKAARIGLMEAADGGTLFLDELPSLSLPLQAKLLTSIEDHSLRRVGASRPIPVDARVIAATNADLGALVRAHAERGARATILLTPVDDPTRYGVVVHGADGAVERFVEKPPSADGLGPGPWWVNAGAYVLDPDVLADVPDDRMTSIEREIFPGLVGDGLIAHRSDGYWRDIGTLESFLAANADAVGGVVATRLAGGPDATLVDPAAQVDP
ncbi:MAG: sigma 54-interacting transcriptional regulator, partial [Opitutaceae bacterium]